MQAGMFKSIKKYTRGKSINITAASLLKVARVVNLKLVFTD